MNVWILQTGEPIQIDGTATRPMRAINLSSKLIERGHRVTLWSSDFDHFTKKHRFGRNETIVVSESLTIKLIKSRGYTSHFGFSRLLDHFQLGWNLRKILKSERSPDVAFVGYPPIEPAWVLLRWLGKRNVPSMLDIKDAWPEVLLRAFPKFVKFPIAVVLSPYFMAMRSSFKTATALSSVTAEFLEWAEGKVNRKSNSMNLVNYLTVGNTVNDDESCSQSDEEIFKNAKIFSDGTTRVTFIGTLNTAFDFEPLIAAAEHATNVDFVIAGSGPFFDELHSKTEGIKNLKMLGWINSAQVKILMDRSTFMIAPYKNLPDFNIHIPNKFFDAMANGKPILTSIHGVARELVEKEKIGFVYENNKINSLKELLYFCENEPKLVREMEKNSKLIYEERYSYNKVYTKLAVALEELNQK